MEASTLDTIAKLVYGGVLTTALFALVIWWITRYIKQRDDFETEIRKGITGYPDQVRMMVKESVASVKEMVTEIRMQQTGLRAIVEDSKHSASIATQRLTEELNKIEKHITVIERSLDRTKEKSDKIEVSLTAMSEKVQFHDRTLSSIVDWAKKTKAELDALSQDYSTTKKVLKDDLIMLKNKKKSE